MANPFGDGIPIPDVIDPPESMEMTLCIPKNRDHMAAFFGALYQLTIWNSWQRDDTQHGKELAAVWWRYYLSWDRQMSDLDCEDNMGKCCTEPVIIHRINPTTGRPEVSNDGGVTWTPDPADIQNQIMLLPPLVGGGGGKTKCDAATNASEHINELIDATGENLSAAANVFDLAVGIAAAVLALFLIFVSAGTLTAPVTAVATAIWAAATSLFALGIDAYNLYWTVDKKDAILCALYCNIGSNGQFTEVQYQAFRTKVKTTLPASPALDIVLTSINAGGAAGLSQMASYGNAALSDCDSCDCGHCDIDNWGSGLWVGSTYYPGGGGTEVGRGIDWIEIRTADRGDGQQVITLTTTSGTKFCGFTAAFVGDAPNHALWSFNYAPNVANYNTMTPDSTNPFGATLSQAYLQADPGSWVVRFTLTT